MSELLCESCGYALTGLPLEAACPECATPVTESLPSRRPGSAWQRGVRRGWMTTSMAFVHRPRAEFRLISIERPRSQLLLLRSTFLAALLASSAWLTVARAFVVDEARPLAYVEAALGLAGVLVGTWCVLLAASWIESVGIQLFGRRRGWRVTRHVATAVCGHAAVGWVMGGLFAALASCLAAIATMMNGRPIVLPVVIAMIGLSGGGLIGLLWFEILVYMGIRACRFANPPDATGALPDGRASQPLPGASVSSSDVGAGAPAPHAYDASTRPGEPPARPSSPHSRGLSSAPPADEPARRADTRPDP